MKNLKFDLKRNIGRRYDGMMGRCYRENDKSFKNYGGRGIRVCKDWILSNETFRLWFLEQLNSLEISAEHFSRNSSKFHLDRLDTNGHYSPENCRIASSQQNQRNRRNARVKKRITCAEGFEIDL